MGPVFRAVSAGVLLQEQGRGADPAVEVVQIQMLVGGSFVTLVGLGLGEAASWHLSPRGLGAILYLVIFGSIVGYSAYGYALRHAPATIVGTYAYVNPVIAVLLGWLLLREPITGRMMVAIGMTLAAVVWIQFSHKASSVVGTRSTEQAPPMTDDRRPTTSPVHHPEAA